MSGSQPLVQTVTRNFLKLGAGELIARVIGFLTMVYLARFLGVEAYGIIGFAYAVLLYFTGLADFGIEALGPREIAEAPDQLPHLSPPILAARLLLATGLVILLALAGIYFMPQPDGVVLAVLGLTLFAAAASPRWIHLGLEKAGRVAVARTAGEVVRALLVLAFVHEAADIVNVPLAQVVGDTLATVMLFWWLRSNGLSLRPPIKLSVAAPVLRRAWPLAANMLLGLLIYNSDLIFLRFFRDAAEVGYYLAAFTLITLLGNLSNTYSTSLLPTLTRAGQTVSDQHDLYHTAMAHVAVVALPVAVGGYMLATPLITFFFGASYEASGAVLQILILSIPFVLTRGVLRVALITVNRQDRVMWITFGAAILNITLNLLLIPRYGMTGAAFSTLISEIVRTLLAQVYVRWAGFPITELGRYWRSLLSTVVMGGVLWSAALSSLWVAIALGGLVYLVALTLSGGIRIQRGKWPALNV